MYSTPELISTEMIKPASKTPNHLRNLNLTYLDHIVSQVTIPLIFFYQADALNKSINATAAHPGNISQKLKQSLSKTLTLFYPLAGRYDQENHTFDCNDMGCVFIESKSDACLSDVIKDPKTEQLNHYLPSDTTRKENDATLSIKITFLSCGGMVIGVCMSHMIGDGTSMMSFMKAWANICRGGEVTDKNIQPIFDMEQHFAASSKFDIPRRITLDKQNVVTRRFVFDRERITLLKQLGASSEVKDPTRVEVVSSFIWKQYIDIILTGLEESISTGAKKNFVASHAVNLRARWTNIDLVNTFGNCLLPAFASSDEVPSELHCLVSKFRKAIRAIDNEYINKNRNGDCFAKDLIKLAGLISKGDRNAFVFSSWTRFPFYEVDYGWGKPIWVCTSTIENNVATLMSTREGDGIEAWISLSKRDMQMFETQFKNL